MADHRRVSGSLDHPDEPVQGASRAAVGRRGKVVRGLDAGVLDRIVVVGRRLELYLDDVLGIILMQRENPGLQAVIRNQRFLIARQTQSDDRA
jgi:hypothetical protein